MHIMISMEQNRFDKGELQMNEKTYKVISQAGGGSIALGIIILITGIASGVLMIINGARLLKQKYKIMI